MDPNRTLRLLRAATAVVVGFAVIGTVWLVASAVLNPDVHARQPGWYEGTFVIPFWVPLILTFLGGCAAVVAVYVKAARRVRGGEDLHARSFRDVRRKRLREELEGQSGAS